MRKRREFGEGFVPSLTVDPRARGARFLKHFNINQPSRSQPITKKYSTIGKLISRPNIWMWLERMPFLVVEALIKKFRLTAVATL